MKKRKIANITCTRTEYGLMLPVLHGIDKSKKLELQLYYTGMHLMERHGLTKNIVLKDFPNAKRMDVLFKSEDRTGITGFMADLMMEMTVAFTANRPDLVLLIGDRPEVIATALGCLYLGIPTAHIHGGDRTSTVDETARHAITKLSHLHFPANKKAAERIKHMGEESWRIHMSGAPALDFIMHEKLPNRELLCSELGLDANSPFILLLQHPVSQNFEEAGKQMQRTIDAIKSFDLQIVAVYPNGDPGSDAIIKVIERKKSNPHFKIFKSLAYDTFLALEKEAAVMVGNSSSAMIESSSFHTPIVDVGERQAGRLHGDNVIHTNYDTREIISAVKKSLFDKKYLEHLAKIKNPWGNGNASGKIVAVLEKIKLDARLTSKELTY